jgi:protein-S-isoprenylcysteine O-methyltransferase Ste14
VPSFLGGSEPEIALKFVRISYSSARSHRSTVTVTGTAVNISALWLLLLQCREQLTEVWRKLNSQVLRNSVDELCFRMTKHSDWCSSVPQLYSLPL